MTENKNGSHNKPKITPKRSSDILIDIAEDNNLDGDLTYQFIINALGERAFGIVILLFSLPTILPFSTIPGYSVIFSFIIILFALEMVFKRESIWLPKYIANKTISHSTISRIILTVVPYVVKLERLSKPRWTFMTGWVMEIVNGITIVCLAFFLMLPIPFSNFIFAGLLIVFSLGLVEKDGYLICLGYLFFIVYILFISFLAFNAIEAYLFIKNSR